MKNIYTFVSCLLVSNFLFGQVTIKGTVTSVTGQPLKRSDVFLVSADDCRTPFPLNPIATTVATADGKFEFTLPGNEPFGLFITGVHHQPYTALIHPEKQKAIYVDIKLATHNIIKNASAYKVVGNFNRYSQATGIPLTRSDSLIYSATIPNISTDTISYQLTEISNRHMIPGQEEYYQPVGPRNYSHEGYVSLAKTKNGKAEIKIDLSAFPYSPLPAVFTSDNNTITRINQIFSDMQEQSENWLQAYSKHFNAGKSLETFNFRTDKEIADLEKAIRKEVNPVLKQVLLIAYLGSIRNDITDGEQSKKAPGWIADLALKMIPPVSTLWGLGVGYLEMVAEAASDKRIAEHYLKNLCSKSPFDKVKAFSLLLQIKLKVAEKKDYKDLFDTLINKYPKTSYADIAKKKYSPGGDPLIGKKLPAFSIESLKPQESKFTETSFAGKYVLIDFWATWCIPCIREFPHLEEAYAKFVTKGLNILSVSMDEGKEITEAFFKKRGKSFEWVSAIEKNGFNSEIAKALEIRGIPFIMLIGPDGNIVEVNESLRGEKLLVTLEKYFK